jgi:hypothetical protein
MALAINDFALACAIDGSQDSYFTYHKETMLIVLSPKDAVATDRNNSFAHIEPFMDALVSHEAIHVAIKKTEGDEASESLDDIEFLVWYRGREVAVTLNNMLFAQDRSGLVLPPAMLS